MNISTRLLSWYDANKRSLPWRGSRDPYVIWISEIIFQQTRIDQGTSYFLRFMERFPTLEILAQADEEEVLRLWQGLGYYSRARNLHETAKTLIDHCDGKFPGIFEELVRLKGVGDYTASCIASICYGLPHAAVDGNVYRVLSRYYGDATPIHSNDGKKRFKQLAQGLIDPGRPGDFNEAMMDLGAMVCTPKHPSCSICPFAATCQAKIDGSVLQLPVAVRDQKKKKRILNYLFIKGNESVSIKKRTARDIWKGLYEFPLVEGEFSPAELVAEFKRTYDYHTDKLYEKKRIKHKLSHQDLEIRFYRANSSERLPDEPVAGMTNVLLQDLKSYPFPKPLVDFLSDDEPSQASLF